MFPAALLGLTTRNLVGSAGAVKASSMAYSDDSKTHPFGGCARVKKNKERARKGLLCMG